MKPFIRLVPTLVLGALAATAAPPSTELLQAVRSDDALVVEVAERGARLTRANGRKIRLPVRRDETLLELTEFDGGWSAAGVRVTGSGRDLVVLVDGAAGIERLPRIPAAVGALRVRPAPLSSATAFEGLAWLEGDSPAAYTIRAAGWSGALWEPPQIVSEPSRGGQAGLVGTVLEDGSWLLVWSGYDGHDSELYWSRRLGSAWSTPRLVAGANDSPDILPTLVPVPGGALVAWAWLDGDHYRLRSARFRDGAWVAHRDLGVRDVDLPRFAAVPEGLFLLYRAADGWAVLELGAEGRVVRRAAVAVARSSRPMLTVADGRIGLRWAADSTPRWLEWVATP